MGHGPGLGLGNPAVHTTAAEEPSLTPLLMDSGMYMCVNAYVMYTCMILFEQ